MKVEGGLWGQGMRTCRSREGDKRRYGINLIKVHSMHVCGHTGSFYLRAAPCWMSSFPDVCVPVWSQAALHLLLHLGVTLGIYLV
jgi:hypothetical protein